MVFFPIVHLMWGIWLLVGTINPKAAPFSMDTILAAIKTALPLIDYQED